MRFLLALLLIQSLFGCVSRPRESQNRNRREENPEVKNNDLEAPRRNDNIDGAIQIPFTSLNGVLHIQAYINGSPIKFIFDSGASDVTISVTEASHLLKNDFLSREDFTGEQNYVDANGDVNVGVTFRIREMKMGSSLLRDVNASVVNSRTASNLLGQSALERFGRVSIDYQRQVIVLEPR